MSVAYVYFEDEPDRVWRGCCHATRECGLMPEMRKQNDDWNRHSKQPRRIPLPMIGSYIFPGVELGRPRYPGATNRLPLLIGQRRKPEQRSLSWPSAANRLPFPVDPIVLCEIPNLGFRFRGIVGNRRD
jgi:hypothetical protein